MKKGFTIIEVIVTFVILSILIFFAIYSFRYSISNIKNASYYLPKEAIAFSTLDRLLGGVYYYVIEKKIKHFSFYFDAGETYIDFITTSPLFGNHISLSKLQFEDKTLFYTEEDFYQKETNIKKPEFTKEVKRVVVFDQIDSLKITYILKDGEKVLKVEGEIPKGIIFDLVAKGKKLQFIFSPRSDFLHNKVYIYNEKYPI